MGQTSDSKTSDSQTFDQNAPAAMAQLQLAMLVFNVPARLGVISPIAAGSKHSLDRWSLKEELGHLIDSATVNHQRIVRTIFEDQPALYDYDGDKWVRLHGYQETDWLQLIKFWQAANDHLLIALEGVTEITWSRKCTIAGSEPMTLAALVDDYVKHMLHHLRHIGIEADDLLAAASGQRAVLYPEKPAPVDFWINELMERRWSPRAFEEGRQVEPHKIGGLLEAARWAPSCFNEQPWRYVVFDGSDSHAMERARGCLSEGNAWAKKAPLLMLSVARNNFERNDKPNRTAQHDVGLASENLVLEAVEMGLVAHQMAGFYVERARREFVIPEGFTPLAMIAIGYPHRGSLGSLPEDLRVKELAERTRKPVGEIAFAGRWDIPYGER